MDFIRSNRVSNELVKLAAFNSTCCSVHPTTRQIRPIHRSERRFYFQAFISGQKNFSKYLQLHKNANNESYFGLQTVESCQQREFHYHRSPKQSVRCSRLVSVSIPTHIQPNRLRLSGNCMAADIVESATFQRMVCVSSVLSPLEMVLVLKNE